MILWVRVDNQRSYRVLCNNLHVNAPHNLLWRALLTSCSRVVRSLIVDKSHMHALPSVPPVTTTPLPAPGPVSQAFKPSARAYCAWNWTFRAICRQIPARNEHGSIRPPDPPTQSSIDPVILSPHERYMLTIPAGEYDHRLVRRVLVHARFEGDAQECQVCGRGCGGI